MADRDKGISSHISFDGLIFSLCETCERMARRFRLGIDEGDVTRETDELQAGSVAKCPFCLLASREVLKLRQREKSTADFRITGVLFHFTNSYNHLRTFYSQISYDYTKPSNPVRDMVHGTLRLDPLRGLDLQTAQLAAKYEYPPNTGSRPVTELIKFWYSQCINQHHKCASQVSRYKPPRLVEVRKDGFRVVVSSECDMMSPYATLSHCWGNATDFLKLTFKNFEQLRHWNPITWLPQTFQDATHLCYNLRIRYVWIDSLCILQEGEGSAQDWSLHVTEMRVIYSNGILNIAASHAANSSEGMYAIRNPDFIRPAILEGIDRFGLSNGPHLLIDSLFSEPGASQPPLNKRGWVFQERLLSQRVVHFEREQVFWECNDSALCETYPAGFDEPFERGFKVPPFTLPTKQNCSGAAERWRIYRRLVEHYYGLQFAFPDKDKLAAFAGIAQHISREFNDDYFAGMFRSQLPLALCWHAVDWHKKCDASQLEEHLQDTRILADKQSHYPSWTWAKLHPDHTERAYDLYPPGSDLPSKYYVTIHGVQTEPGESQNIFGNFQSAHVILEGRLLPWVSEYNMLDPISSLFDGKAEACIKSEELFIIPFFSAPQYSAKGYHLFFLIVHRLSAEKQGSYERVGVATLLRAEVAYFGEHKKGLTSIDEMVEADVVWREYISPVKPERIILI